MSCCRIILLSSILLAAFMSGASQDRSFEVPDYGGEAMHYNLKYGIFNIGFASISFLEDSTGCGYNIKAEAQSIGLAKIFRNLNYRFECCMDQTAGLPNSAIMSLKDGKYNFYNELIFDQYSRIDSAIISSLLSGKHIVSKNIYDILTGFYHFRMNFINESIDIGEDVVIKTFFTDEPWDLRIRYAGEETIKTDSGEVACYKYNPVTIIGRYFHHDNDMSVWFTKDENHIPVRIRLDLKVGSINGELEEYQKPTSNH
ncbi:MAG: DUF3108 domain-containing protein [Bacteroidia bacterium]|nr:MAG: DUF3108 domain-containing protein [Bacteroidia bacterium]